MKKLALILCLPVFVAGWGSWAKCGDIEFGIEALYWRPAYGNIPYARLVSTTSDSNPTNHMVYLKSEYDWGFRLYERYLTVDRCHSIGVSWARSHNSTKRTTRPGADTQLITLFTGPDLTNQIALEEAHAKLRIHFDVIDVDATYALLGTPCFDFDALYGIRYYRWQQKESFSQIDVQANERNASQDILIQGAGPRIGCHFVFEFLPCIAVEGVLAGSALFSRGQHEVKGFDYVRVDSNTLSSGGVLKYPELSEVIGGFDMRLALVYWKRCFCCNVKGEVGYSYQLYWDLINRVVSTMREIGQPPETFRGDGFSGFYLGASFLF